METQRKIAVSIIVPVFNEAENVQELVAVTKKVLVDANLSFEILLVDDGSTDGSVEILDRLAEDDPRVKVVFLRRNFGQTAALMAGLDYCVGEIVIPLDADLQNDPRDVPMLVAEIEKGFDVVSGWRKDRKDRFMSRRVPSIIANKIISYVLGVSLHDFGCSMKAYRSETLRHVRLYGEMHRFVPIFAHWEGARVTEAAVRHHPRKAGVSKYGIGRTLRVALDILLLYFFKKALDRPIHFFGAWGVAFGVLSIFALIWAICLKLFMGVSFILTPLPLLAATLGLTSVLVLMLGILAEIQIRTYFESQGKTPYSIRRSKNTAPRIDPR